MKFIQTSDESRDCTCNYTVQLNGEYTVRDFIDKVLAERSNEWGKFCIFTGHQVFTYPKCEYRYGSIVSNELEDHIFDMSILSISANGGWSVMDYLITLNDY